MRKLSIEIIMNEGRETRSFEGANGSWKIEKIREVKMYKFSFDLRTNTVYLCALKECEPVGVDGQLRLRLSQLRVFWLF